MPSCNIAKLSLQCGSVALYTLRLKVTPGVVGGDHVVEGGAKTTSLPSTHNGIEYRPYWFCYTVFHQIYIHHISIIIHKNISIHHIRVLASTVFACNMPSTKSCAFKLNIHIEMFLNVRRSLIHNYTLMYWNTNLVVGCAICNVQLLSSVSNGHVIHAVTVSVVFINQSQYSARCQ